jgi:two-component system response regulator AtoC
VKGRILVVDDEKNMGLVIHAMLERAGFEVLGFQDSDQALEAIESEDLDVIVTDLYMPGAGGMEILAHAKKHQPRVPVVMITAFGTVESAVSALKSGAFDFITKPFEQGELLAVVEKASRTHTERQKEPEGALSEGSFARREDGEGSEFPLLMGSSAKAEELRRKVDRAVSVDSCVLIEGESGTGKELVAQAIHARSARAGKPLIKINCAVVPGDVLESELFGHEKGAFNGAVSSRPGRFELAHEGTLFLDEVLELPLEAQAKLLRALNEGEFERVGGLATIRADVRVIAACDPGMKEAVRKGRLLEELYYRLSVVAIDLPPLRERREDIAELANRLIERFSIKFGKPVARADERLFSSLRNYRWPGNIRQLESVIERMVLMADGESLDPADLPEEIASEIGEGARSLPSDESLPFKERIRRQTQAMERELIEKALNEEGWNVTRTAESLGLSRKGLQLKMKELGIHRR